MKISDSQYRNGVGIVLRNRDQEIFIGRRKTPSPIGWQMPQGGIDEGETPEEALWRELDEEVGTSKAKIVKVMENWLYYDIPEPYRSKWWGGQYIGQKQKWFLLDFVGFDSDIDIFKTQPSEFCAWRWEIPSEVLDLAIDFKREIYTQVLKEFSNI
jgi:putative (di)nucleoside polyphosphate hydrolase